LNPHCSSGLHSMFKYLGYFSRPDVVKPLALFLGVAFLQQASGMSAITYYAVDVIVGTGSSVNEVRENNRYFGLIHSYRSQYVATILYALMRLIGQFAGFYLLLRWPRKVLLVSSALAVAAGMAILGAAAHLNEGDGGRGLNGALGALPLVGVIVAALAYQLGLGPIPWSYTSEATP